MVGRRENHRLQIEVQVTLWLQKNPGTWWRVPEIAESVGVPVPAANTALRGMSDRGAIERDTRRKRRNGKEYPVYMMHQYSVPSDGPSWLCPKAPSFTNEQIKGLRTVLGFTGNVQIKKAVEDAD